MTRAAPGGWAVTAFVAALGLGGSAAAAPPAGLHVAVTPPRPQPGDVVLLHVSGAPAAVRAEWDGRPVTLFPVGDGMAGLVGLDLDTPPGAARWRLLQADGAAMRGTGVTGTVTIRGKTFPTQHLTLPPGQVDLDPPTLARVEAEQKELRQVLARSVPERFWRGPFQIPVDGGRPTGGFGLRRVLNGQPRSPHAGFDWAAPPGTPVLATNAGRVVLVADHFFAGRNVVIDHGLGLFTLYFHLSEAGVAAGDRVREGQPLGAVGATGRVTGPHLHFAVILGGARVDPESLLALVPPPDPVP